MVDVDCLSVFGFFYVVKLVLGSSQQVAHLIGVGCSHKMAH